MSEQYERPYLDSSVWVGWIKREQVRGTDRWRVGEHILRHAQSGAYPIYISAFVIAEVHKRRNNETLTTAQDERILALFEADYIQMIDVDRLIGEEANKLCQKYGFKPVDAVHLACALRAGCDYLLSWDTDYLRYTEGGIKIETPQTRGQQFMDF